MLLPKKTKYRRVHRGRRRGVSRAQTEVQFGDFGIKALENGWVTNRQIEAARIAMTRTGSRRFTSAAASRSTSCACAQVRTRSWRSASPRSTPS